MYLKVLLVSGFTVTAKVMPKYPEIDTVSILCSYTWPFNLLQEIESCPSVPSRCCCWFSNSERGQVEKCFRSSEDL